VATIEDDGPHLRPEFLRIVRTIDGEMTNLQPGEEVLIIADSRTPANAVGAFFGEAMAFRSPREHDPLGDSAPAIGPDPDRVVPHRYEPADDHETPSMPLVLTIEDSWITDIGGDPLTSERLRNWLAGWAPASRSTTAPSTPTSGSIRGR
jgi:hypothetical protein